MNHHDVTDEGLALFDRCFDALDTHDPALGRIMAISALCGLRVRDMGRMFPTAFSIGDRVIRPLFLSEDGSRTVLRKDLQVLPISEPAVAPIGALVDEARFEGRHTLIDAQAASYRWVAVRHRSGLPAMPMASMRALFAAVLTDIAKGVTETEVCLWRTPSDRAAFDLDPKRGSVRHIQPLFDAVAERLAPIVTRPSISAAPG